MKRVGLRIRLFLSITLVVVIAFVFISVSVSNRTVQLAKEDAFKLADEISEKYSYEIKSEIQAARVTSESLKTVFETLIKLDKAEREVLNEILINSLLDKDYIISFCVAFEPNLLDGKDALYGALYPVLYNGDSPIYDETGRYAPYWSIQDGVIGVDPINNFDYDEWYYGAKTTMQEYITEPFFYPVQGTEVLMTSLVFPVIIDDEFIGIVSSDMPLDSLQELVSNVNVSGLGEFTEVFSNSGTIIAHPDSNYFNKGVYESAAFDMLKSEPKLAPDALTKAEEYLLNVKVIDEYEYQNDIAFVDSLREFVQSQNVETLDLSLLTKEMAKELLNIDEERLDTAKAIINAISNGESYMVVEDGYYKVYMPIQFSDVTMPWSVAVNIPMSEVLKVSDEIQQSILITSIIAISFLAVVIFIITRSVTKPITDLTTAVANFGENNMNVVIPESNKTDEIGILTKTFNNMSERIRVLINTLQDNADELERNNNRLNYLNDTLIATNLVSEALLNTKNKNFDDVLYSTLMILGESVNSVGTVIFENYKHDNSKIYSKILSSWVFDDANRDRINSLNIDLDTELPMWNKQLSSSSVANVIDGSNILNKELFDDYKTLLLLPLMINERYWGFFGFIYNHEYMLSSDEAEILRSSGMMIVSSILQKETSDNLKEAENLASTDSLTGLTNRNGFLFKAPNMYQNARSMQKQISILFFDIDHFKQVNDKYGHLFGDEVLKAFAKVIQKLTKPTDICCRYGGEEFLMLLNDSDKDEAANIANTILDEARKIRIESNKDFSFTVSIGLKTAIVSEYDTLNGFIKNADEALYRAKSNGRNQLAIYDEN